MIADCSKHGAGRHLNATIKSAGSDLVLAADTVAMAEPAAARGLVAPAAVEVGRGRQPKA